MNKERASETPYDAYARALRYNAYALAAVIAKENGLGQDLLVFALHHAMCRYEALGYPEVAVTFAERLGFHVVTVTPDQLASIANIEGSPETMRPPSEPRTVN